MVNDERTYRIAMIGARDIPVASGSGGVERHVEELGARLVQAGHQVTVFVRAKRGTPSVHRDLHLRKVHTVPLKGYGTLWRVFASTVYAMFGRYDIIHFHGVGPATFAWLPRLFRQDVKVVATFHSIDRLHAKWGPLAKLYLRYGEWAAVKFPHVTIAVSRSIQKYCDGKFRADTFYVPNAANPKEYPGADLLTRWELRPEGYILAVGRLVGQKGFHFLIEAYRKIETGKKLVIVGGDAEGGDYADYLRWMASGNSNIVFTGFQSGRALAQLYANTYLYVHPSQAEGLSVSILEAMAAGRCVLVSDIPENREPLDHSGLTFASANADDLAEQMRALLNHPEVVAERGARGAKWVACEYSWERVTEMTQGVYRKLFSC